MRNKIKKNKLFKIFFLYSLIFLLREVSHADQFWERPDFKRYRSFIKGTGFEVSCGPRLVNDPMMKFGPHFNLLSTITDSTQSFRPSKIKIMFYNFRYLLSSPGEFIRRAGQRSFDMDSKSEEQINQMVRLIKSESPHVIVGSEIESLAAMEETSQKYLKNQYFSLFIPDYNETSNLGFFIQKMAYDIEVQSYREITHVYLGKETHLFTRDVPVLSFRKKGASPDSDPDFVVIGTHFKAMKDLKDSGRVVDSESKIKRAAQIKAGNEIVIGFMKRYPSAHIFYGGDFNSQLNGIQDPLGLKEAGFVDGFDLVGVSRNSHARVTHSSFPRNEDPEYQQIDGVFVDPATAKSGRVLRVYTVAVVDAQGKQKPLPSNIIERDFNTSDHKPLIIEVDLEPK